MTKTLISAAIFATVLGSAAAQQSPAGAGGDLNTQLRVNPWNALWLPARPASDGVLFLAKPAAAAAATTAPVADPTGIGEQLRRNPWLALHQPGLPIAQGQLQSAWLSAYAPSPVPPLAGIVNARRPQISAQISLRK